MIPAETCTTDFGSTQHHLRDPLRPFRRAIDTVAGPQTHARVADHLTARDGTVSLGSARNWYYVPNGANGAMAVK